MNLSTIVSENQNSQLTLTGCVRALTFTFMRGAYLFIFILKRGRVLSNATLLDAEKERERQTAERERPRPCHHTRTGVLIRSAGSVSSHLKLSKYNS